ncbi:hypothetical protein [Pseudoxanthomonas sp. PXM02]|uniref:hypothetical protein n=1 Tax=Pseudoxanthomonas sp. PXM02 TaxID=2769294 RepID=UPI0017849533|nr:hypothetical protein [Pseudoxanthomonas sp. PXM02]MBD9480289.1 hypothetical protein [Pseudoxanthomonas sp. PXM02]
MARMSVARIAFALWLLVLPPIASADADRYENPTLQFVLTKPATWHFMSLQQHRENLKRVEFESDAFKQQVIAQSTGPLVIITRHPEPYAGLNASLKVSVKPFGALPTREPVALVGMILPTLKQQLSGVQVIQEPRATTVAGLPAAHVVLHYTLGATDGDTFATASELWIVPNGDFFYMIGAGYARGDAETRAEIAKVIDGLAIARQAAP